MCKLMLDVPEEIFIDLHESEEEFMKYVKRTIALDLYKNKKVSLGYCASVADMSKEDFIKFLGVNEVSLFLFSSDEEFLEELVNA